MPIGAQIGMTISNNLFFFKKCTKMKTRSEVMKIALLIYRAISNGSRLYGSRHQIMSWAMSEAWRTELTYGEYVTELNKRRTLCKTAGNVTITLSLPIGYCHYVMTISNGKSSVQCWYTKSLKEIMLPIATNGDNRLDKMHCYLQCNDGKKVAVSLPVYDSICQLHIDMCKKNIRIVANE